MSNREGGGGHARLRKMTSLQEIFDRIADQIHMNVPMFE